MTSGFSCIYIIERPDRCKIGMSRQGLSRARGLAKGAGLTDIRRMIALPVDKSRAGDAERLAHGLLAEFRIEGEWFSVSAAAAEDAVGKAIFAASSLTEGQLLEIRNDLARASDTERKRKSRSAGIGPRGSQPDQQQLCLLHSAADEAKLRALEADIIRSNAKRRTNAYADYLTNA